MTHPNRGNVERTLGTVGRNSYRVTQDSVDLTREPREVRPLKISASPQDLVIDLNKTALIIIDMQNDFCAPNGWLASLGVDVSSTRKPIAPIKNVTAGLRARSVPVIWVNWGTRPDRLNLSPGTLYTFHHAGSGTGIGDLTHPAPGSGDGHPLLQKDSWGSAIVDELSPPLTDIFVDKHRISGFWDTPLDSILRNLAIRTLLFAGVNADECVLATLMDANFHGYDTLLIEDCVGTSSPSFCTDATLYNVRFCFGFSLTSEALLRALEHSVPALGRASTTPGGTSRQAPLSDEQATTRVVELYHDWARALTDHDEAWFERHIAGDFSLTAHPFALRFDKRKFIEVDMQIENTKINFLDIRAHAAGDILVSQAIAEVKEDFTADLGQGMPSATEITKLLSGQVLAYSSAWRKAEGVWQCFDHHMIGPVRLGSVSKPPAEQVAANV